MALVRGTVPGSYGAELQILDSVPAVPAAPHGRVIEREHPHGLVARGHITTSERRLLPDHAALPGQPGQNTNPQVSALTPFEQFRSLLVLAGSGTSGKKWQCPGHGLDGDHSHALSLSAGANDRALVHCFAGCTVMEILGGFRLPYAALTEELPVSPARWHEVILRGLQFPPPRTGSSGSLGQRGFRFEAEHPYGDPTPTAWKVRYRHPSGAKEIRWESLNPDGLRVEGLLGRQEADAPLYEIRQARMGIAAGEPVILVESESSVDALVRAGWYSTTWCGGAGSPPLHHLAADLGAANVVLIPDHDAAGLTCAERIRTALPDARTLLGEPGEDARDLLARLGPNAFRSLITEELR